jgi:FMN reductase
MRDTGLLGRPGSLLCLFARAAEAERKQPVASILILSGSPSAASRTLLLARNLAGRLQAAAFEVDFINVRDLPAEDLIQGRADAPAIQQAIARVEAASAVVVATPIYKASFSGTLKTFLDLLPQFALTGKTVFPVATGGSLAHVLAIDYGLRPVLASLNARHIVNGWFFLDKQLERVPPDGLRIDPDAEEKFAPFFEEFIASVRARAAAMAARP